MKPSNLLIFLCSLICIITACSKQPAEEQTTAEVAKDSVQHDSFYPIQRGTNIAHWLSQSDRRGEERAAFFQQKDVEYLAELGFDHIRIPIDEEQMWDTNNNKETAAFDLLHNAINWSREAGLKVIVDLHILRSHHFNRDEKLLWTDSTAQEGFFQCWRDLSAELQKYPNDLVAYELMNEPVADDPEDWNQLVARLIKIIRENEPERTIVVGSNRWQHADTFDELKVPGNDENIILSYHFYSPFLLTHYKASWTDLKDYGGPVSYPGALVTEEELSGLSPQDRQIAEGRNGVYNIDTLEHMMQEAIDVAAQQGLNLYCGEWGTVAEAPEEDRLRWYADMQQIFEQNNIANANWNYKSGNFGIVDYEGTPNEALIQILTGREAPL